jgi:hypothetical protein
MGDLILGYFDFGFGDLEHFLRQRLFSHDQGKDECQAHEWDGPGEDGLVGVDSVAAGQAGDKDGSEQGDAEGPAEGLEEVEGAGGGGSGGAAAGLPVAWRRRARTSVSSRWATWEAAASA